MPNYFYDVIAPQARQALEDVFGVKNVGIQPFASQQITTPGQQFAGQQGPMASRFQGMGVSGQVGPVQGSAQFDPRMAFQGAQVGANMPMAGGNVGVNAQMGPDMALQRLAGTYQRGPVDVGMSYQPGAGVGFEGGYQRGAMGLHGGYDRGRGAYVNLAVNKRFAEGGLATSIRMDPEYHDRDVEFVDTRNQRLRELVQKAPLAKGGLAVKKGGAWTRKEGQNPEGGLNAKGRASLKAQGHDIKPPVSAKQAANSPKAAARRKSFCARMSGMPGPMKDDQGRPTRKALSLRKWDC